MTHATAVGPKFRITGTLPDMGVEEFSDRVRRLRARAGLTQHELAMKARISFQAIGGYEDKKSTTVPRRPTVIKLARALDADPDYLLEPLGLDLLDDDERADFIDEQRQRLDKLWPQLTEHQRRTLMDFLDAMCERPTGPVNRGVQLVPGSGDVVPAPRDDDESGDDG